MVQFYQPIAHTDEEVRAVIGRHEKVVLFLNAEWCGDCKAIKPFVQNIREHVEKKAYWIDADRDDNIAVAQEHNLRGIPAFVFFENGQQVSHIGDGQRLSETEILDWVAQEVR